MDTQGRTTHRNPRRSLAAGRATWRPLLIAGLLAILGVAPGAVAGEPPIPAPAATDPGEALEFLDVLVTRSPLPGTNVQVGYRFERSSGEGSTTHLNELVVTGSFAVTDWLQLSAAVPYQFLNTRTADGWTATNGVGDAAMELMVTPLQLPALGLAVGGGLGLGVPTGSMSKGTGGQWTLTPFLMAGKLVGPVQLLADVGYQAELRTPAEGESPQRRFVYDVAVGYPLREGRLFPFLELNGAYTFTGDPNLRNQGQLAITPGVRLSPVALFVAGPPTTTGAPPPAEKPWWDGLSWAIGAQFPVTASRDFDWALLTSLKYDF